MSALASRRSLLVLVCALLVAAPISLAEEDVYDDGDYDDYPDEGQASDEEVSEKDVVVLTSKNFDAVISKAKYALVRRPRLPGPPPPDLASHDTFVFAVFRYS